MATLVELLKQVYASAPTDPALMRVLTLEIRLPGGITLRYVQDGTDHVLGGNLYEQCPLEIDMPGKDSSGSQKLRFAVGILDGTINNTIQDALDSGEVCYVVCSEWLLGTPDTPAKTSPPMPVLGGEIDSSGKLQVDASYFDLLNTAWPRERYTAENAPGTKYL